MTTEAMAKVIDEELVDGFASLPALSKKSRAEIRKHIVFRFAQAYLRMSEAGYRPGAPSDGFGYITISDRALRDPERLAWEAAKYGMSFYKADDEHVHNVGCTNYKTNRASVYTVEAARLLCGASPQLARKMLMLAVKDIDASGAKDFSL